MHDLTALIYICISHCMEIRDHILFDFWSNGNDNAEQKLTFSHLSGVWSLGTLQQAIYRQPGKLFLPPEPFCSHTTGQNVIEISENFPLFPQRDTWLPFILAPIYSICLDSIFGPLNRGPLEKKHLCQLLISIQVSRSSSCAAATIS